MPKKRRRKKKKKKKKKKNDDTSNSTMPDIELRDFQMAGGRKRSEAVLIDKKMKDIYERRRGRQLGVVAQTEESVSESAEESGEGGELGWKNAFYIVLTGMIITFILSIGLLVSHCASCNRYTNRLLERAATGYEKTDCLLKGDEGNQGEEGEEEGNAEEGGSGDIPLAVQVGGAAEGGASGAAAELVAGVGGGGVAEGGVGEVKAELVAGAEGGVVVAASAAVLPPEVEGEDENITLVNE